MSNLSYPQLKVLKIVLNCYFVAVIVFNIVVVFVIVCCHIHGYRFINIVNHSKTANNNQQSHDA